MTEYAGSSQAPESVRPDIRVTKSAEDFFLHEQRCQKVHQFLQWKFVDYARNLLIMSCVRIGLLVAIYVAMFRFAHFMVAAAIFLGAFIYLEISELVSQLQNAKQAAPLETRDVRYGRIVVDREDGGPQL